MVRPAGKRGVVAHMVSEHGLSQRRACRLASLNLSTWQYKSHKPDLKGLRERIVELASERRRFGYRRLHILLRREGWDVNHKAVHRIYREEGLQVRKRKRIGPTDRQPILLPERINGGERRLAAASRLGSRGRKRSVGLSGGASSPKRSSRLRFLA